MNNTRIQYDQIESLANNLRNQASNMEQLLNDVANLINQIGNSDVWNGTAAQAAKESFGRLANKMPEFYQATNNCYSHLMSVVQNYKSVDTTIANG